MLISRKVARYAEEKIINYFFALRALKASILNNSFYVILLQTLRPFAALREIKFARFALNPLNC
jgi:hypothetical protein